MKFVPFEELLSLFFSVQYL